MTMNKFMETGETPAPRFSLVNIRREALDLTALLDGASAQGATWSGASNGIAHGLSLEVDGERAAVSLDFGTFALTETASDNAPENLREVARTTYLRYLRACLSIGSFALEAIPIQRADGTIRHDSLRLDAVDLGAEWLGQLPTVAPAGLRRLPLLSELTVIDMPLPSGDQDTGASPAQA